MAFNINKNKGRSVFPEPGQETEILKRAKEGDHQAREDILETYKPLALRTATAVSRRGLEWGRDDELSVALMAVNEAIDSFKPERGASFATYASLVIRSRLTDHFRREIRQRNLIAATIEQTEETLAIEEDWLAWEREQEIKAFTLELKRFGLTLKKLMASCPKHRGTRHNLIHAAKCLADGPLIAELRRSGHIPMRKLAQESGVHRKTLERGRGYLIAMALILGTPNEYSHLSAYLGGLDGGEEDGYPTRHST